MSLFERLFGEKDRDLEKRADDAAAVSRRMRHAIANMSVGSIDIEIRQISKDEFDWRTRD